MLRSNTPTQSAGGCKHRAKCADEDSEDVAMGFFEGDAGGYFIEHHKMLFPTILTINNEITRQENRSKDNEKCRSVLWRFSSISTVRVKGGF